MVDRTSAARVIDPTLAGRAALDRVLELVERRKLSATELRVLLVLRDRGAGLPELAEALDQRPDEITRAGRSLSFRGLIRWQHVGRPEQTRLEITRSGLTTVRALLTAAGATSAAVQCDSDAASATRFWALSPMSPRDPR
jgi:DNA-binding MarR family transcriptional regulator